MQKENDHYFRFLKLNEKIINGKKAKNKFKKIAIKNFYRKLHEVRSDGNFKPI